MPSATHRLLGNPQGAIQGLAFPASYRPNDVLISPMSLCAAGIDTYLLSATAFASGTYPASNRALGYMFEIADYFLVRKVWWFNGTTATTNNADVGVYSEDGATKLVSGGSTLIATANVVQEIDCTDTLLPPGRYWCVYNQNGTTATPMLNSTASVGLLRVMGWAQFAGAVSLGAAFTPAAIATTGVPFFGIAGRTQVA